MPITEIRDIALELSERYEKRERRLPKIRGEIVEKRWSTGEDSVHVEGRPGYVWVMLFDQAGNEVPIFNRAVNPINGMPVIVSRMPGSSKLEIISIDQEIANMDVNYPGTPYLQAHHLEHEWPDGAPGIDAVNVYPRSWTQLKTYPTNPVSLSVNVSSFRYYYQNNVIEFGGGVIDLTASVPGAANQARLVLVYLNPVTNALGLVNGAIGPAAAAWALTEPVYPDNVFPSVVVRLENGQATIVESDIRDRRFFLDGTGVMGGWPFLRVITVDPTDPDADYTTIQAAVNAATTLEDVILISPNAYAGFTCAKTLTFVGMGSHVDFGTSAPHTRVGFPVTLTGDDLRFVGLYFLDTVTIQKPVEFIFCGFEETTAIQSHATISLGRIRLVDCFVDGDIDMSPGVGMDVELVRTFVDGNIDMGGKSLSLWSTDIDGTVTNAATRTNYDGPHIQRAMFGPDVLTVGTEGAQYATAAAAVAAVSAGQAIFFQEGTWTCDGVIFPADITVFGQDRERTILQTTTTAPTLTLGVDDYFYNLTIKNEQSSIGFIAAVRAPISGSATLQDCLIICNNTRAIGVDPAYGTYMDATYDGNIILINTDIITSTASALGWSLAAYANQNATVEVHGGRLDAGTVGVSIYDAYAANVVGATVALYGAVVVHGNVGVAGANGSVRGHWYSEADLSTVIGGAGALAPLYGQKAQASWFAATQGDAQASVLTLSATTTDNVQAEMFLDGPGGAQRMVLPSDTTWAFEVQIVARRTDADNESAAYWARGCIDNNAGVTALVGAVSYILTIEDTAAWVRGVSADNANNALRIQIGGENGKNITWVARVVLTQVTG